MPQLSASHLFVRIVRIFPEAYPHYRVFDEVVESLLSGLIACGIAACVVDNEFDPNVPNIVIGAHLLSDAQLEALPQNVIVYNFEQFDRNSIWMRPAYINALSSHRCWDYSRYNIAELTRLRADASPEFVPLGYAPLLTRLLKSSDAEENIDVLFYGCLNPRRKKILDALAGAGYMVHIAYGVYGAERDSLIGRAKLVLNIHYYDSHILEAVRLSYLMANSKAVVSECADDTEIYPHYRDGICLVAYDDLVNACVDLLANSAKRQQLGKKALSAIKKISYAEILMDTSMISSEPLSLGSSSIKEEVMPKRINLGSGKDWRKDFLNADILDRVNPDWKLNICSPLPWGTMVPTRRFGDFLLEPGFFDLIIANDVLEHLPDLVAAMTSCLSLLKQGGEMHIQVPYDLSFGAWQDPTHIRAFNERSWLYYTDWYWYLGWTTERFHLEKQEFVLSAVGKVLKEQHMAVEEILRTPRAIDSIKVVLKKIIIT
jgi:SAM-dependent methyltransferase